MVTLPNGSQILCLNLTLTLTLTLDAHLTLGVFIALAFPTNKYSELMAALGQDFSEVFPRLIFCSFVLSWTIIAGTLNFPFWPCCGFGLASWHVNYSIRSQVTPSKFICFNNSKIWGSPKVNRLPPLLFTSCGQKCKTEWGVQSTRCPPF